MSELSIRERTGADLARCVRALREVHLGDGYPIVWPDDPQSWLTPADLLAAWVADTPHVGVVGHVALTAPGDIPVENKPDALVSRLFVAPAGRRRQTGSRLLAQVQAWAVVRGLTLMLEVAELGDGSAIAFYERRGWTHVRTGTATWTTPAGAPVSLRYYRPPV